MPGAVEMGELVEELLKFTLTSSIDGTLDFDLGLSKDYCSNLLTEDPLHSDTDYAPVGHVEGIPQYPLYKHLASALSQSINAGAICIKHDKKMESIQEINSFKQEEEEEEWYNLILDKGSELRSILQSVEVEFHVQEPFFSMLKDGVKTVEGRCAVGKYSRISSGASILFNKCLVLCVQDVHWYASFSEMLKAESLAKVLPGVKTVEEGVQIYWKFYTEEQERSKGVLAISVAKPAAQPYFALASILSCLGYKGIQRLLGCAHTVGTNPTALPPSRSTLLSSFGLPHNPNVKSSTLTTGARALAKHINRCSSIYWGTFVGSDSNKNEIALNVINRLVDHCCWLNLHIVPPHGDVFEIRVAEGYGARWSSDGTKFIGFLEPYMEDGHSKRWKH
ncbi:ASCH domain [Dillenia turbinata]|uniref:ASCH domain n=1 Tax=Dillenia turbinata TaxID=194707 RepID=A0AAN8UKN6_9MAGN